jgi:cell division protease FtsH
MKYIIFLLVNLTNSLAFNLHINTLYRNQKKNNIKLSIVPNYDPSKLINSLAKSSEMLDRWDLNDFLKDIKNIESVSLIKDIDHNIITSLVAIDKNHISNLPELSNLHYLETGLDKINNIVIDNLIKNDIYYKILQAPEANNFPLFQGINTIINIAVFYIIINIILSFVNRKNGGFGGNMMNPMNVGKLQSSPIVNADDIDTRFDDVAGCDEAKYELEEVVEFLKKPEKFNLAGANIPKGVLLEGPPGTGKTLLARAVAGESGVSFVQASGSEFIQMFVGVGASRVRDLFELAKANQPCVIFIDEIDAVGRKRGEQFGGGGNDEREQTLNQILTSMDGFDKSNAIIVLAATNRVDILDSALTRSGRFDRKVKVDLPDVIGRKQILNIHLRNKLVEPNIDYDELAYLTSGFSGADLQNLANEAAIFSVRNNSTLINSKHLIDAFEKLAIGIPKLSKKIDSEEDELVAYHEAGHTITSLLFNDFFDVRKVTIVSNSNGAGGYTLFTPKEKYNSYPTKKFILAKLIVTMGGRAAETVFYNKIKTLYKNKNYNETKIFKNFNNLDITTGASSDLKQADQISRQYIQLFGIEKNDILQLIQTPDNPYNDLAENSKNDIDQYVNYLIDFALNKAIYIIESNLNTLIELSSKLIEYKSVNSTYLSELNINTN